MADGQSCLSLFSAAEVLVVADVTSYSGGEWMQYLPVLPECPHAHEHRYCGPNHLTMIDTLLSLLFLCEWGNRSEGEEVRTKGVERNKSFFSHE
jgi:hypothetical protein